MINENDIKKAGELLAEFNGKTRRTKSEDNDTNTNSEGSSKPMYKRSRRFCLTTYISPTWLSEFLSREAFIQHYAYCTHDRDVMDDGTPKTTHTHVILYTYDAKTSSAIKKIFDRYSQELAVVHGGEPQNTLVQVCNDVVAQYRYLVHADDPNKAQYEDMERHTDNASYWKNLCYTNGMNDASNNVALQIVDDILQGTSTREMLMRYGRDYTINRRRYLETAVAIDAEERNEKTMPFDEQMLDLVLQSSPYFDIDIAKFKEILHYVNKQTLTTLGCTAELYLVKD